MASGRGRETRFGNFAEMAQYDPRDSVNNLKEKVVNSFSAIRTTIKNTTIRMGDQSRRSRMSLAQLKEEDVSSEGKPEPPGKTGLILNVFAVVTFVGFFVGVFLIYHFRHSPAALKRRQVANFSFSWFWLECILMFLPFVWVECMYIVEAVNSIGPIMNILGRAETLKDIREYINQVREATPCVGYSVVCSEPIAGKKRTFARTTYNDSYPFRSFTDETPSMAELLSRSQGDTIPSGSVLLVSFILDTRPQDIATLEDYNEKRSAFIEGYTFDVGPNVTTTATEFSKLALNRNGKTTELLIKKEVVIWVGGPPNKEIPVTELAKLEEADSKLPERFSPRAYWFAIITFRAYFYRRSVVNCIKKLPLWRIKKRYSMFARNELREEDAKKDARKTRLTTASLNSVDSTGSSASDLKKQARKTMLQEKNEQNKSRE